MSNRFLGCGQPVVRFDTQQEGRVEGAGCGPVTLKGLGVVAAVVGSVLGFVVEVFVARKRSFLNQNTSAFVWTAPDVTLLERAGRLGARRGFHSIDDRRSRCFFLANTKTNSPPCGEFNTCT